MEETNLKDAVFLLDSHHGIYIPQIFCNLYKNQLLPKFEEEIEECKDPENEFYWESWLDILDYSTIKLDGQEYTLHQDDDLWALPLNSKS